MVERRNDRGSHDGEKAGGVREAIAEAARLSGTTAAAPAYRVRSAARKSPAVRRRLMLALAAGEEELMTRHASAAAEFVAATADELSFERALSIYMRLVNVPARDRRTVAVRALALLGDSIPEDRIPTEAVERDRFIDRIVRRVRGRQDTRLRAWVGTAAAEARDSALRAHLHGAREVLTALEGVVEPAEAIQYYIEAMDIEPGWAETIFNESLPGYDPGEKSGQPAAD